MPLPVIDAVDSVLRKYRSRGGSAESVAMEIVNDAGLAPDGKVCVVVIVGDDAMGADEEVTCRNAMRAVELIAARVRNELGK